MRPLRDVVERVHPPGLGMWDVLSCGHREPYTGVQHRQRRCNGCPPEEPQEERLFEQESLLDG